MESSLVFNAHLLDSSFSDLILIPNYCQKAMSSNLEGKSLAQYQVFGKSLVNEQINSTTSWIIARLFSVSLQSHGVKSGSRIINTMIPKRNLVLNDVLRPLLYFKYLTHDKTKTKWKFPNLKCIFQKNFSLNCKIPLYFKENSTHMFYYLIYTSHKIVVL